MKKDKFMSEWKNHISGCFGGTDKIFAGHPSDEDRAFELLTLLRTENIGWGKLEIATRSYLSKCSNQQHMDKQIAKMESSMRPWLLD